MEVAGGQFQFSVVPLGAEVEVFRVLREEPALADQLVTPLRHPQHRRTPRQSRQVSGFQGEFLQRGDLSRLDHLAEPEEEGANAGNAEVLAEEVGLLPPYCLFAQQLHFLAAHHRQLHPTHRAPLRQHHPAHRNHDFLSHRHPTYYNYIYTTAALPPSCFLPTSLSLLPHPPLQAQHPSLFSLPQRIGFQDLDKSQHMCRCLSLVVFALPYLHFPICIPYLPSFVPSQRVSALFVVVRDCEYAADGLIVGSGIAGATQSEYHFLLAGEGAGRSLDSTSPSHLSDRMRPIYSNCRFRLSIPPSNAPTSAAFRGASIPSTSPTLLPIEVRGGTEDIGGKAGREMVALGWGWERVTLARVFFHCSILRTWVAVGGVGPSGISCLSLPCFSSSNSRVSTISLSSRCTISFCRSSSCSTFCRKAQNSFLMSATSCELRGASNS